MRPVVLNALRSRRAPIRHAWETLLRLEPVTSALALPDALIHYIPASILEILTQAARFRAAPLTLVEARRFGWPECPCGRNPYLAFYRAGEQAMLEGLVLLHCELPPSLRSEGDLAEILYATRLVARANGGEFCSACILRHALQPQPTAAR